MAIVLLFSWLSQRPWERAQSRPSTGVKWAEQRLEAPQRSSNGALAMMTPKEGKSWLHTHSQHQSLCVKARWRLFHLALQTETLWHFLRVPVTTPVSSRGCLFCSGEEMEAPSLCETVYLQGRHGGWEFKPYMSLCRKSEKITPQNTKEKALKMKEQRNYFQQISSPYYVTLLQLSYGNPVVFFSLSHTAACSTQYNNMCCSSSCNIWFKSYAKYFSLKSIKNVILFFTFLFFPIQPAVLWQGLVSTKCAGVVSEQF